MFAQLRTRFTQAAQIDDPPHISFVSRFTERHGQLPVTPCVFTAGRHHRVDQVKRGIATLQLARQTRLIREIDSPYFYEGVRSPGPAVQLRRRAHQAPHGVARGE